MCLKKIWRRNFGYSSFLHSHFGAFSNIHPFTMDNLNFSIFDSIFEITVNCKLWSKVEKFGRFIGKG